MLPFVKELTAVGSTWSSAADVLARALFFRVTLLFFGENFPNDNEGWPLQLYSVTMALVGVAGFALVLALTEQVLLEVLRNNVETGTQVWCHCLSATCTLDTIVVFCLLQLLLFACYDCCSALNVFHSLFSISFWHFWAWLGSVAMWAARPKEHRAKHEISESDGRVVAIST